jgi:hypothetical protein
MPVDPRVFTTHKEFLDQAERERWADDPPRLPAFPPGLQAEAQKEASE